MRAKMYFIIDVPTRGAETPTNILVTELGSGILSGIAVAVKAKVNRTEEAIIEMPQVRVAFLCELFQTSPIAAIVKRGALRATSALPVSSSANSGLPIR